MIEFDNTKYYCENCGKELTTDEITSVLELSATSYSVDFKCNECGYYSRYKMVDTEHILDGVLLRKFTSIHYNRLQACGGCEYRMYNYENDGIEPCKIMGEFYNTGYCKTKKIKI